MKYYLSIILFTCIFACKKKDTKAIPVINTELSQNYIEIDSFITITNHKNQPFTLKESKGTIQVINFFFSTCKTICPLMEDELAPVSEKFPDVNFYSYTIDPENDSIEQLASHHLEKSFSSNQYLLRTSKSNLKTVSKYYLSAFSENDIETLYHTSYVVLLDEQLQIRGFYNSLDADDIEILMSDIEALKN